MVHEIFNQKAKQYDAWFDKFPGNQIFPIELDCVKKALAGLEHPWLEVGVGTGRFAKALGIEEGVDPAEATLKIAEARGIEVKKSAAENLPYQGKSFGAVVMVITLCFLDDPIAGLKECKRVLKEDGRFVLGIILADSHWGKFYQKRKEKGHDFYKHARFYNVAEVEKLFLQSGFVMEKKWSALHLPPGNDAYPFEEPTEGISSDASFIVFRAK